MKVIDITGIRFASLNQKYRGNFKLTDEYKSFRDLLLLNIKKVKLAPPYYIFITVSMYQDIDNIIKPILDSLEKKEIIDNDRNVRFLEIKKNPIKRGELGNLIVYVEGLS